MRTIAGKSLTRQIKKLFNTSPHVQHCFATFVIAICALEAPSIISISDVSCFANQRVWCRPSLPSIVKCYVTSSRRTTDEILTETVTQFVKHPNSYWASTSQRLIEQSFKFRQFHSKSKSVNYVHRFAVLTTCSERLRRQKKLSHIYLRENRKGEKKQSLSAICHLALKNWLGNFKNVTSLPCRLLYHHYFPVLPSYLAPRILNITIFVENINFSYFAFIHYANVVNNKSRAKTSMNKFYESAKGNFIGDVTFARDLGESRDGS